MLRSVRGGAAHLRSRALHRPRASSGFEKSDEAAGAIDVEGVAIFEGGHAIAHGHDRRNLHFARGDRAMRKRAAGLGDDGDSVVEERSPGGIGGAGDEDSAFGEGSEVFHAADEVDGTGGLAGAAGKAGEGRVERSGGRRRVVRRPASEGGPYRGKTRRARGLALRYRSIGRSAGTTGWVEGPGGGALAVGLVGLLFGADGFAE